MHVVKTLTAYKIIVSNLIFLANVANHNRHEVL